MTDWLALALTPGVGPRRFRQAFEAKDPGVLPPRLVKAYERTRKNAEAERLLEAAAKQGAQVLGPWDPAYPEGLWHLADPPVPLFVRGELVPWQECVAVVGTRRASPWALHLAEALGRTLAEAGLALVSGLARGIDGAAHRGAIQAGGRSLAVLGSALDRIYPPEHRALAEASTLISEFAFGTGPRPEHFPRRNRIVAALARAVVVVEAPERSGALITAREALELGRDVLAVPGRPSDPKSRGANLLIRDGAGLLLQPTDLLEALGLAAAPAPEAPPLEGELGQLYAALKDRGEALPDDLAAATGLAPTRILALLTELELKGLAQALPGGRYRAV